MRSLLRCATLFLLIATLVLGQAPLDVQADCPGNRLQNAGFEEGMYQSSLSSWMSNGWHPWSLNQGAQTNREPEYKIMNKAEMASGGAGAEGAYRVFAGNMSQAFFTAFGTHTSGFYQQVAVARGSRVTFSAWVQIDTGMQTTQSEGHSLSDLDQAGNYRAYVGIDPYGNLPPGYGAMCPDTIVWSNAVLDRETRQTNASGSPIDAWVELKVTTIAQSDKITVYTKGQPEFPTNKNISFWDEACLIALAPPTNTPLPATATPIPTDTLVATATAEATGTAEPSPMPLPTETPPSATPQPSSNPVPATVTPLPPTDVPASATPVPANATDVPAPTAQPTPVPSSRANMDTLSLVIVGGAVVLLAVIIAAWLRGQRVG